MAYEIIVSTAFFIFVLHWRFNLRGLLPSGRVAFLKFATLVGLAGIGGLVGARLFQVLVSGNFHEPGAALWGAIIGGYLFIYIGLYLIFFRGVAKSWEPLQRWADAAVPGLCLAHAFGRSGCLWVGCCFGLEGCPVIEVEMGFMLLGWILLQTWWVKRRALSRPYLAFYLYGYGLLRFVLEFYRGDEGRGEFYGLSSSQWASILAIFFSGIFLDFRWRTRDKSSL